MESILGSSLEIVNRFWTVERDVEPVELETRPHDYLAMLEERAVVDHPDVAISTNRTNCRKPFEMRWAEDPSLVYHDGVNVHLLDDCLHRFGDTDSVRDFATRALILENAMSAGKVARPLADDRENGRNFFCQPLVHLGNDVCRPLSCRDNGKPIIYGRKAVFHGTSPFLNGGDIFVLFLVELCDNLMNSQFLCIYLI